MAEFIYEDSLTKDMPWQFQHESRIGIFIKAVAQQLQDVYEFYESLDIDRRINNAVGKQLDLIGDIVCLTRAQAGLLTGNPITVDILDDETYRKYLKYKILVNTSDCTYSDLMSGLSMFVDDVIYYREDVDKPATIVLNASNDVTTILTTMPITRPAGVAIFIEEKQSLIEQHLTQCFAFFDDMEIVINGTREGTYVFMGVLYTDPDGSYDSSASIYTPPNTATVSDETVVFE